MAKVPYLGSTGASVNFFLKKTMLSNTYSNEHPLSSKPLQLSNVDLLRGLAAIAILVWHYQHFYYPMAGKSLDGWSPDRQPLFASLKWLYLNGWWGVQFFWALSGFIFFHVYAQRRAISVREFFSNRFARLYPLHFVTLCLVATLQVVSLSLFGHFQIYPENNLYHFVLNLFFASNWGFQSGNSFNAPIWSISVEVLAYGMFFAYLKSLGVNLVSSLAWFVCSLIFYNIVPNSIFQCAALFSLGGFFHQAGEFVRQRWGPVTNVACSIGMTLAATTMLFYEKISPAVVVPWALFPALIWLAAALERIGVSSGRVGLAFGHLTYASYLIHVPIQIIVIMVLDGLIGSRSMINSTGFLLGFVATVLILAWFTYRLIERPAQEFFRRHLAYSKATQLIPASIAGGCCRQPKTGHLNG
jgi:peptidoglycan/LPS O-acetylase OafA/YrhL